MSDKPEETITLEACMCGMTIAPHRHTFPANPRGDLERERDALRADIERLNAYADRMERWAKAEQEERYKAEDQRTDLRAEVARLKHLHDLDHSLADQREAECERLRAALEEIMRTDTIMIYTIAQRALDGPKRA